MNYTSYYSNIRNLKNIVPIAISVGIPKYLPTILRYAPLAPTWKIVNLPDGEIYTAAYKSEILAHLDPQKVLRDLAALAGGRPFALMCYEKPPKFCHRHIASAWIEEATGSEITEYGADSLF